MEYAGTQPSTTTSNLKAYITGSIAGTYSTTISGLSSGTTYYVRAYATNPIGTTYGSNVAITTTTLLTDIVGNSYPTASIFGQVWIRVEKIKTSKYDDGTNMIYSSDTSQYATYYYHIYNNNNAYATTYGYMYNGYVVGGTKDACPTGWHVPTATEWGTLAYNLGGSAVAGGKMNDTSRDRLTREYVYWNASMTGHDNSSLFYARGGGYYFSTFAGMLDATIWWTSTSKRYVRINYNSTAIQGISSSLTGVDANAFYIRCKKD